MMNLLVRAWHAGTPSRIHAVKSMLLTCVNMIERLSPEYLLFAADGGHKARTKLYPDYKAHRPPKPPGLQEQIDLAERALAAIGWPVIRVEDWEADDVVASLATQISPTAAGVVIASSDKDLLQLVGSQGVMVYHPWDKGSYFGAKQVEAKFGVKPHQIGDYLAMCGDGTDGVPGVKGIGEKTAAELLAVHGDLASVLEQARLLRIIGAKGKHLVAGADAARMSRQLVELQRDIPIMTDWHDWPAASPRAGWVEELRRLDLGMVVQRLAEVIPTAGRVRSGSPAITMSWEHCELETLYAEVKLEPVTRADDSRLRAEHSRPRIDGRDGRTVVDLAPLPGDTASVSSDRGNDPAFSTVDNRTERRQPSPDIHNAGGVEPDATVSGEIADRQLAKPCLPTGLDFHSARGRDGGLPGQPLTIADQQFAALLRAMATDFDDPKWCQGFPVLRDYGPSESVPIEMRLRSVYAAAFRSDRTENLWKPDSDFHFVEQLGLDRVPFYWPGQTPQPVVQPGRRELALF